MQTCSLCPCSLGSAEQLLSPECWKATLRALGCCAPSFQQEAASAKSAMLQGSSDVLLSDKQVHSFWVLMYLYFSISLAVCFLNN